MPLGLLAHLHSRALSLLPAKFREPRSSPALQTTCLPPGKQGVLRQILGSLSISSPSSLTPGVMKTSKVKALGLSHAHKGHCEEMSPEEDEV